MTNYTNMKVKAIILASVISLGMLGSLKAQELKIGYANIEAILLYMPETKTMNQDLKTYGDKLGQELQSRQTYLQSLMDEYQQLASETQDEATLKPKQDKLRELDQELQTKQQESQQKLLERRQTLMEPIIEKMQGAIKELATEDGFDVILNSVDGNGVSIILHGPEENDVTKKLMTKLGIKLPEGQ